MKISKKCRYGLRALIDLSANSVNEYIVLGNIAERNNISPQYLEQVFADLRRAGIVKGIKGAQGGYRLNIAPDELTVAAILEALDGNYHIDKEDESDNTHGHSIAVSIQELVIDRINAELDRTLQNFTLEDLRKHYLSHKEFEQDMYYI